MNDVRFSPFNTIVVILAALAVAKLAAFLGATFEIQIVLAALTGMATAKYFPWLSFRK